MTPTRGKHVKAANLRQIWISENYNGRFIYRKHERIKKEIHEILIGNYDIK